MRSLVDEVLAELSPRFESLYARVGRPSIPPEKLLRAQLLEVLYTVRSERQLMAAGLQPALPLVRRPEHG
jgi:transposase